MFKKINNAHAISNEGYIVKFDRTYVSYQDGKKAMHIDAEFALEPTRLVIYKSSIDSWFKPFDTEVVNDSEKQIILDRVLSALQFLGVQVEVE